MIQIEILNGTKAGTRWVARRFPFRIGRDQQAGLSLPDDGVWDSHCELNLRSGEGFSLSARPEALTLVNGEAVNGEVRLRNGDRIEAGSVALHFSLSPTAPSSSTWVELLIWLTLGALCLGQVALIYFVLP